MVMVADGSQCVINDGMIGAVLTQSQNVNLTLNGGSYMSIVSTEEGVDFTKFLGKGKTFVLGNATYGEANVFGATAYGYTAGDELIKVTKGTSVVSVNVNGLVTGGFNHYEFKVEGRASKLQVVYANGSTYTLSRYSPLSTGANSKGLVSIKSYDKNGKEVSNGSADIAYEIWTVNMSLTGGTYEVKAKFANEWELGTKSFDIELETGAQVEQVTIIGTAKEGFNKYAVKVSGSAQKLQVIFFNGGTYTFDRNTLSTGDSSRGVVSIKSYDKNGKEVEYGSENAEYETWVLNMSLKEGNYTVKAKCDGIWESIGKVFKVSFSKTEAAQVKVTAAEGENGKYTFTLNGTAQKLQIIHSSGATNTFTKDNSNVSVKYYNAKNVEVAADSYDVAYEVWTISKKLSDGEYSVITKYDNGTTYVWSEVVLKFDVELSVLTAELTVATEEELLEELAKVKTTGGTVKLGSDITLSQTMALSGYGTEENPVILDLNGNKITGNIVAVDGSFVEIQNGTIVYTGTPSSETDISAVGCIESKLTMKNLTLNMTDSLVGIANGDLTVEDCTINGGWNGETFSNYTRTVDSTSTITFVGNVTVGNIIFVNNMNGGAGAIFKANGTYSINGKDLTPTEDYTLTEADTEISQWYTEAQ